MPPATRRSRWRRTCSAASAGTRAASIASAATSSPAFGARRATNRFARCWPTPNANSARYSRFPRASASRGASRPSGSSARSTRRSPKPTPSCTRSAPPGASRKISRLVRERLRPTQRPEVFLMFGYALRFVTIASAAVTFAACAPSSGALAPPGGGSSGAQSAYARDGGGRDLASRPKLPRSLLYVSDEGSPNVVNIYSAKNPNAGPLTTITAGLSTPDGMAIDSSGDLYVTNAGNNTIAVYHDGDSTPFETYSSGLSTPANIAIGSDGTLYVVNLNGGSEYINEYPPGSMTPNLTINAPHYANGLAVDPNGTLYAAYHDSTGHGWVYTYPKGSSNGTNLNLQVSTPAGLQLDKKGNLIVADATLPAAIKVFAPGATTPKLTVTSNVGNPFLAALNGKENRYYVSDSYPHEAVDVFTYPKLKFLYKLTAGVQVPAGVVTRPTAPL